jgi:hypothetical protein
MTRTDEGIRRFGPPTYHERQITPNQFRDMQLGYLSNLGAGVELVWVSGNEAETVEQVVIDDVTRTFWAGSTPDNTRLALPEDKESWLERDCVTFYRRGQASDGAIEYNYDHLPAYELGLVEKNDGSREYWPDQLFWYLRWPE